MLRPPLKLPKPPPSHEINGLADLLLACPPFLFLHAPISTNLFVDWVVETLTTVVDPAFWVHLNGLEYILEQQLFGALARFISSESVSSAGTSKPGSWLALTHSIETLSRDSAMPTDEPDTKFVFLERAERLSSGALLALSRLAESTLGRISLILISSSPWEVIRPTDARDPYQVPLRPLNVSEVKSFLAALYPPPCSARVISPYHPALEPLFHVYIDSVVSVLVPSHSTCPLALSQIALSRWPYFVGPVIKEWRAARDEAEAGSETDAHEDEMIPILTNNERIKLVRWALSRQWQQDVYLGVDFSQRKASEVPALRNLSEWTRLDESSNLIMSAIAPQPATFDGLQLGQVRKWMLVASWLASVNPARTDMRLFARFAEGKRGKRRRRGGPKGGRGRTRLAVMGSSKEKVPQRLMGPGTFPLERMLAILAALLQEHFPPAYQLNRAGATDMFISRVQACSLIAELTERRLLQRVSVEGKVDAVVMRCAVKWESIRIIGRELGVRVEDLMWDRNQ